MPGYGGWFRRYYAAAVIDVVHPFVPPQPNLVVHTQPQVTELLKILPFKHHK
jgi:hypothetical protein